MGACKINPLFPFNHFWQKNRLRQTEQSNLAEMEEIFLRNIIMGFQFVGISLSHNKRFTDENGITN